jgi:hypothetical protein
MIDTAHCCLFGAIALCAFVPQLSCGGDHDRLAKTNSSSSATVGGEGGTTTVTVGGSGGTGGIEEPPGAPKLTIVNGVVDSSAIRLCFLPYPDGDPAALPWPDAAGLPFARGAAIDLAGGVIPEGVDVEVVVFAGGVTQTGGMTCAQVIAVEPPGVRVRTLAVLPADVFSEQKSLLLVPDGCVGGPGHTNENEEKICGVGYSSLRPNASLTAGFMSRITDLDRVPMQFAQASRGLGSVSARITPGMPNATAQVVVDQLTAGAIAPFPPFMGMGVAQLSDVTTAELELTGAQGNTESAAVTFGEALANSTLGVADVTNGENLVFVTVGAPPSLGGGSWWRAFDVTVVPADP